ncbi:Nodule Cysteine-Rich (NCR) secreted peptide [Medicago truncatula]|uniref:Nodule Cysteine-Rich (NCR) secreted peptide n=1 Tax=Medicago truncatula TaxID=3880 RepID=A0A072US80_MEDTR|nr:Nodule Cysteine-Rich (NCR) secreted peptide [Medicago truncatula]
MKTVHNYQGRGLRRASTITALPINVFAIYK